MGTMVRIGPFTAGHQLGFQAGPGTIRGERFGGLNLPPTVCCAGTLSMLCSLFPSTYINLYIYTHTNIDCSCITFT